MPAMITPVTSEHDNNDVKNDPKLRFRRAPLKGRKLPKAQNQPLPPVKYTKVSKREHRRHSVAQRKIRRRGPTGNFYRHDAKDSEGWEPVSLNPIIIKNTPRAQPRDVEEKPSNTWRAVRPQTPPDGQKAIDARSIRRRNVNGGVYRSDQRDAGSWTNPKEILLPPEMLPKPPGRRGYLPPSYVESAKMNCVIDVRGDLKEDARKVRRRNPNGHFYRHDDVDARSWEKIGKQTTHVEDVVEATKNVVSPFVMPNNGDFIGIYSPPTIGKHFPTPAPPRPHQKGGLTWEVMETYVDERLSSLEM